MPDLPMSRRALLCQMARAAVAIPLTRVEIPRGPSLAGVQYSPELSESDDELLDEIERATFLFFVEQANPETGIVRDRFNVRSPDKSDLGSIAATGFGFTALCI